MFSTILVPLDGSPFAEQALPWALSLARRSGGRVELVRGHVLYALKDPAASWCPYDPAAEAKCKREEQLYLEATARWLAAVWPVPITTALVEGLIADAILERIQASKANLVVMTTHGRGPLGRFFLGGVADEVIRRSTVPVLLVQPHEPPPGLILEPLLENVLVALDGSALAEQALEPALGLAHLMEARCTLLRVVEPGNDGSASDRDGTRPPESAPEREAQIYLQQVAGRLRDQGVEVQTRVRVARHIAAAIREQARGRDLIALATHGRSGLRRLVLGSVADQVIRGGSTPVLVYRPRAEKPLLAQAGRSLTQEPRC
jgi:nucleotide-binding universal stress UspA family protein